MNMRAFGVDSITPMPELLLIYDKQCPFCDRYARLVRIRASVGELRLVNAREPGAAMDEISAVGLDIDQGMVLKIGERLYYGAEAMQVAGAAEHPLGRLQPAQLLVVSLEMAIDPAVSVTAGLPQSGAEADGTDPDRQSSSDRQRPLLSGPQSGAREPKTTDSPYPEV